MKEIKSAETPSRLGMRPSGASVVITEDEVIKVQDPKSGMLEHFRTSSAKRVADESGLFTVPEIRFYNANEGIIRFEKIHDAENFSSALSHHSTPEKLVSAAGEALAALHTHLDVPEGAHRIRASDLGINSEMPLVPLHGDYGLCNIFTAPSREGIIIIDWSSACWIDRYASLGPAGVDLGVFLFALFYRRPFGHNPIPDVAGLGRTFLRSYRAASAEGLCLRELRSVTLALLQRNAAVRQKLRGVGHRLAYQPSIYELRCFLRKICSHGL